MAKKVTTEAAPAAAEAAPEEKGKKLSAYIREIPDYLDMKPADIVSLLASKGIEVKIGLVNSVRAGDKKKASGAAPGSPRAAKAGSGMMVSIDDIDRVKELVEKMGIESLVALAEKFA